MEQSDLRYEWRAWGALDGVADRLGELGTHDEVREGIETYIVSTSTVTVNPKLRGGQLDVKVLRDVADGFEQWEPLPRISFPITAAVLDATLFARLGVEPPAVGRDRYTEAQLVDELIARHPSLVAVAVAKHRDIFDLDECIGEWATITIGGQPHHTAAIESANLDALRHLRREAGLDRFVNTSYPTALHHVLHLDPHTQGTNDG